MEVIYFQVSLQEIKSTRAESEKEQIKLFKRSSETKQKTHKRLIKARKSKS